MTTIQVSEGKVPSELLSDLIVKAADNFVDFTTTWLEIVDRGKLEGFTEAELKMLIVPHIKDEFRKMGMTESQIQNKLYYKFHALEEKQRAKEKYTKSVLENPEMTHNNVLEDSSSDWDRDSAMEEISRLHNELAEKNEVIKSFTFEENPDIFRINQKDPNSMVFTKLKGSDAIDLVRNDIKKEKFYDIAWKEAV